jgi:hypothetical protein
MLFEKVKTLREVHKEEMAVLVQSEIDLYMKEYFKENPSVIEITVEGDDCYDDNGGTKKVVYVKVKLDNTLDIDNDGDDTEWGHEELIQEDLYYLADEICNNVNKTWKRN